MANETIVNVIPEGVPVPDKKRKLEEDTVAPPPVSKLLIKRLSEKARLPTRGSAFAAGYDLYRYAYFFLKLPCISNNFHRSLVPKRKLSLLRARLWSIHKFLSQFRRAAMVVSHPEAASVCGLSLPFVLDPNHVLIAYISSIKIYDRHRSRRD